MTGAVLAVLLPSLLALAESGENQIARWGAGGVLITPNFLYELADESRTNNPALLAAGSRVAAARAGAASVRTWEDPMFMFGGAAMSGQGPMATAEGDLIYGLEQKLPLWGKPRLAREVANAEIGSEMARADYQFQILRLEISRQVFKIAVMDAAVAVGREDLEWLEAMTRVADDRYRTREGSQIDLLRMQNERSRRAELVRADFDQRLQEHAELNRFLGRRAADPWPEFILPTAGPAIEFTERLENLVLKNEARLKVLRQEVVQARAVHSASERQRLPDVRLGISGRQYSGDGEFREGMFSVTINIPWFNGRKYGKEVERDRERLRATEQEVADYELFATAEARRIVTSAENARRRAALYRDEIIPRSELAFKSAHAAWISGRGMFLDMMESRRMLLEARLDLARAIAEQYSMLLDLTLCCGAADLEALEMLNVSSNPAPATVAPTR